MRYREWTRFDFLETKELAAALDAMLDHLNLQLIKVETIEHGEERQTSFEVIGADEKFEAEEIT